MSNAPENSRKALGKGLSSLLPVRSVNIPTQERYREAPINSLPVEAIEPNPLQPRSVFDAARLAELSQSIRANGIIQPLIVRKVGEKFYLVSGTPVTSPTASSSTSAGRRRA